MIIEGLFLDLKFIFFKNYSPLITDFRWVFFKSVLNNNSVKSIFVLSDIKSYYFTNWSKIVIKKGDKVCAKSSVNLYLLLPS